MELASIEAVKALAGDAKRETAPYEARGTVTKVSGGQVFVRLDGSNIETPVDATTASVRVGDSVSVHVSHNDTHITGNRTSPSQGAQGVLEAVRKGTSGLKDDVAGLIKYNAELEQTAQGWDFIITAEEAQERFDPIGSADSVGARVDVITGFDRGDGTHSPGMLDELSDSINAVDESIRGSLDDAVSGINAQIVDANGSIKGLQNDVTKVVTHIRIGGIDGETDAGIQIYADGKSESLTLKKDSITFFDGSEGATEITNRSMNITNANVSDYLHFGNWAFFHRDSNGNMTIKWIGN